MVSAQGLRTLAFMAFPDLSSYDIILINTSGGKDSQTMLRLIVELATQPGLDLTDRLVAVHADLGRVEWPGTAELAQAQVEEYGVRFIKVTRPQGDLLDQIEARGMFPSSSARYCTSDHKRGQVAKVMTALVKEKLDAGHQGEVRILNCMGLRAQESPARARKVELEHDKRTSNGKRHVDTWLPLLGWTEEQVWADIKASGIAHHPAYDAGMPRLSCAFCVLGSRSSLVRAAQLLPELAEEYAQLEERIDHTIQHGTSMREIIEQAAEATEVTVELWAA